MARYTKEELFEKAAPYFSQGEKVMHATEDGNFFYDSHKTHAINHSRTAKVHWFTLTANQEINEPEETQEVQEQETPKRGRKPKTE